MTDASEREWGEHGAAAVPDLLAESRRRKVLLRSLLAAVLGVAVARFAMTYDRAAFVEAWGRAHDLDMTSFIGQQIAERETPGSWDSALFSLLCVLLLLVPLIPRVARGAPWARNVALVLAAMGGLNSLGTLAQPAPWWYHLTTTVMVVLTVIVIVVIWRTPVVEDPVLRHDIEASRRERPAT